jgi:Tol biopolymer transport system component
MGALGASRAIAAAALVFAVGGQQPAVNPEVYLVRVPWTPGAPPAVVTEAINLTNSGGYDNQPGFLPDNSGLLFASDRDGQQTDIYRYDFAARTITQVTRTPEREYSPTVTPDGRTFSVVRVEADGAQRLWRFDLDGSNPRVVLEQIKPVGYHVWIDATRVALFVLGGEGQPATLQLADTTTGRAEIVESGIGRSLTRRPERDTVVFVSQPSGARRVVKEFDPRTRQTAAIAEVPAADSQDCAWTPDGTLLMTSGTKIFAWPPSGNAWREVADVSAAGTGRLTRLAVGPRVPSRRADGTPSTELVLAVVGERR